MTTQATFSVTTSKGVSVVHLPDELLSPLDVAQFREAWFVWLDEARQFKAERDLRRQALAADPASSST